MLGFFSEILDVLDFWIFHDPKICQQIRFRPQIYECTVVQWLYNTINELNIWFNRWRTLEVFSVSLN